MDEDMNVSENEPATKGDLRAVKGDLRQLSGELKEEMGAFRNDFLTFRSEMRDEFAQFRDEIRELFRPITVTLAHHTAELADIRGHIKDKMVTRDEFHSRMDGFTGRVVDSDYSTSKNRERLDDHAKRIKALEDKSTLS
jgi:hypothetical protein